MFLENYFNECVKTICALDKARINQAIDLLVKLRKSGGRLFVLGVGGSAANASHAVNDFRKLCGIEAYCPSDNVSELTAVSNDLGFEHIFRHFLEGSRLSSKDALLIFSVGGGCKVNNLSVNLIKAIDYGKEQGAKSIAILGKDNGYAAQTVDVPIIAPVENTELTTPISEAMQGMIWHAFVSSPTLQLKKSTWTQIDESKVTMNEQP